MLDILDDGNPWVERFAAVEHRQWCDWMGYFFSKCQPNPDGSMTAPPEYVAALYGLMTTPYDALPNEQQAHDRREVARYWGIVMAMIASTGPIAEAE